MNNKTTPKDFFLHLSATAFLYTAVIALINLAFEVINRILPDALQTFYNAGSLVWPISILIVMVPVTYVIEWLINRDISKMPEKRGIWIRRWRIYLTLFLTGVTIIVDIITLINTYLNGEISGRFIYKVLIVLVVSGVVFAYYILDKDKALGRAKIWRSVLMWFGVVIIVIAIVAGFIIVGSPNKQRSLRFDQQRLNDLQNIQYQITNYWQKTGNLPATLSEMYDPLSGFTLPRDPKSNVQYEYSVKSSTSFSLCATFDLGTDQVGSVNGQPYLKTMPNILQSTGESSSWDHGVGRACFERTIDPRLYPPITPKS